MKALIPQLDKYIQVQRLCVGGGQEEGDLTPSNGPKALQYFAYTAQCYHGDKTRFQALTHKAHPASMCTLVLIEAVSIRIYTDQSLWENSTTSSLQKWLFLSYSFILICFSNLCFHVHPNIIRIKNGLIIKIR